jgi:hypothetical protein
VLSVFKTPNTGIRIVTRLFLGLFLVGVFFIIASYFLAAPLGLSLFFGNPDGAAYAERHLKIYLLIFMLPFQLPVDVNVGGLFSGLMVLYTGCLVTGCLLEPNLPKTLKDMVEISPLRIFRNWILAMPLVSSMLLLAIVLLQSFQEAAGIPTGGITFTNQFETLTELAYSPLLEEIGFRITPIGAFLALESVMIWRFRRRTEYPIRLWKMLVLSILAPERSRRFAGLKTIETHGILRGIGIPGWVVVLLTSGAFGLAHFLSGSGWEIGKISSAFVAGLTLSLVFWRYGAHAAILLHWFFNYYSYVYQLASDTYAHTFSTVLNALDDITFWLGIFGWIVFLLVGVLRIHAKNR